MLLVDDHERESPELELVGEKRRRSEEHARLAGRARRLGLGASVPSHGARHEPPADARGVEQWPELLRVLTREHRGRGHHRGLCPGVRARGQRDGGHGSLARADVAEKKAVHHARRRHVGEDLVGGGALLFGEGKGHRGEKRVHVRAEDLMLDGARARKLDLSAREERELKAEQLVVGEPSPREPGGGDARGEMHLAEGAPEGHEAAARGEARGQEVAHVAHVQQRRAHDPSHPRHRQPLAHAMHGQHARVRVGAAGAHNLMERGLHLLETVAEGHLAGKRDDVPLVDLLGDPGLSEERRLHHARLVHDHDVHDLHAGPRELELDLVYRAHHGDLAADVREADLRHAGEVEVTARHMGEEVPDTAHA